MSFKANHKQYLDTLLQYYEEEVSGESYFYGLADHFDNRDELILLAKVERHAARTIQPLLSKYGLLPRSESVLAKEGMEDVARHTLMKWQEFVSYMVDRYPKYLDDFAALEDMAPAEDLRLLRKLTAHEVAAIEFANREASGDTNSVLPLQRYLAS